jgi:DNA polymerase-1
VRLQQEVAATVLQQGYVETILGRKIPVEKDEAYKGTNYLVQSSATADLIKLKIVECANAGLGEFFRLPIHDELMFEVPTDILDDVMPIIQDVMTETKLFKAPCTASPEAYKRWGAKYRD